jgi:hypothetical protein
VGHVIKKKCSDVRGGLTGYEWYIYSENDKSSDECLSTFEGATERRTEELNFQT